MARLAQTIDLGESPAAGDKRPKEAAKRRPRASAGSGLVRLRRPTAGIGRSRPAIDMGKRTGVRLIPQKRFHWGRARAERRRA